MGLDGEGVTWIGRLMTPRFTAIVRLPGEFATVRSSRSEDGTPS